MLSSRNKAKCPGQFVAKRELGLLYGLGNFVTLHKPYTQAHTLSMSELTWRASAPKTTTTRQLQEAYTTPLEILRTAAQQRKS